MGNQIVIKKAWDVLEESKGLVMTEILQWAHWGSKTHQAKFSLDSEVGGSHFKETAQFRT